MVQLKNSKLLVEKSKKNDLGEYHIKNKCITVYFAKGKESKYEYIFFKYSPKTTSGFTQYQEILFLDKKENNIPKFHQKLVNEILEQEEDILKLLNNINEK